MAAPPDSKRLMPRRKRALDLGAAIAVLLVAGPLMAVLAALIGLSMGRPILFKQVRAGHWGRPFQIIKFRTMRPPQEGETWYSSDPERVTRLGRFLRATSLDELPELLNVLRGEMSLVGPRPLLMEYLPNYTADEYRRHALPPGMTGLAQVSGRQDLTFSERLALDLQYVDTWTLRLDVKILARTLVAVMGRKGFRSDQRLEEVDDLGLMGGRSQQRGPGNDRP